MKKFLTILLAGLMSLGVMAQKPTFFERIPEPVKVITLYTGSIILEGIGDGLYDDGQKALGKSLQAVSLGMALSTPFIFDVDKDNWAWYLASYVSLRIGFFDYAYNTTRGLPLGYIGNTSYTDKFMQQVMPPGNQLFARSIFITLGVAIPINELK